MSTPPLILPQSFYARSTLAVARDLLGARLVRIQDGIRLSGVIVETEAYVGETDLGCHAHSGRTARNQVMYAAPGHAYVYFTYGMHWMLNTVTEQEGFPAAVLLRAIIPLEGTEIISARRRGGDTRGPGKLTQALGIDRTLNGADLCQPQYGLWIETGETVVDENVIRGAAVGTQYGA